MLRYLFATWSILLLAGCQMLSTHTTPYPYQRIQWEKRVDPNCTGDFCVLVNIDTLEFKNQPQLNQIINQRLLSLAQDPQAKLPNRSLDAYATDFLTHSDKNWQSWLQASFEGQVGDVVSLEFISYIYTGGAHGNPERNTLLYDTKKKVSLTLDDLLLPNKQDEFWQLAEKAYLHWLNSKGIADQEAYLKEWPFQRTENIILTDKAIYLDYPVYVLAPYSSGNPVLKLPKNMLGKLIKAKYLQ